MKSSLLSKYEWKIVRISAFTTQAQGKNSDNLREKPWLHKFILKITDLSRLQIKKHNCKQSFTFTTSCSTDEHEVALNHEIYLELYICQVVKNP